MVGHHTFTPRQIWLCTKSLDIPGVCSRTATCCRVCSCFGKISGWLLVIITFPVKNESRLLGYETGSQKSRGRLCSDLNAVNIFVMINISFGIGNAGPKITVGFLAHCGFYFFAIFFRQAGA